MANNKTSKENRSHRLAFIVVGLVLILGLLLTGVYQVILMFAGNYEVDTVQFTLTDPATATSGADGSLEPGIWINTNISLSFWSRTVKSSKPYSIEVAKTDTSYTYATVSFTTIDVTYDDGVSENSVPNLPLVIQAQDYSSTNSTGGGQLTTSNMRLISGSIPGIITRDQPFTLKLEGYFTLDDGSTVPFTIDQHYDAVIEQTRKPARDVLADW